jgi:hypothetical protein
VREYDKKENAGNISFTGYDTFPEGCIEHLGKKQKIGESTWKLAPK